MTEMEYLNRLAIKDLADYLLITEDSISHFRGDVYNACGYYWLVVPLIDLQNPSTDAFEGLEYRSNHHYFFRLGYKRIFPNGIKM